MSRESLEQPASVRARCTLGREGKRGLRSALDQRETPPDVDIPSSSKLQFAKWGATCNFFHVKKGSLSHIKSRFEKYTFALTYKPFRINVIDSFDDVHSFTKCR